MMMKAVPEPLERYDLRLRSVMSAGEAVGTAVFEWAQARLGVTINEMFGQTEMNYIVGNSHLLWPARPGSMGRPYPGHRIAVIDNEGREVPRGEVGDIAVNRLWLDGTPDPVFFLGYHQNPEGTRRKYSGDWCRTGDMASMDEDGYLWYRGRSDDMFKSAGYRIGPSEIENCLVRHEAVANAAVVPSPDETRGAVVKAFIVLAPGRQPTRELEESIRQHVRQHLAPYEYPKEIEFIEALPMTTTGKVQRRVLRLREEERKHAAKGAAQEPAAASAPSVPRE
jgi:acetyl-CoA synthetase